MAALPRRHALAKLTAVPLRRLAGEPFVAVRPDVEPAWAGACERALLRARVRLEVVQETDSKIALLGLVAARVGCAIVSESMRHLARDGVVYRDIVGLDVRVPLVGLLTDSPSPRARAFFDAAI